MMYFRDYVPYVVTPTQVVTKLFGFYKSPDIMALRMPDRKLLLLEHVHCSVNYCKLIPMDCLILVILLRYVLCI